MECPECGSTRTRRSKRRGAYEQTVLAALWVYPFRCRECKQRFFHFRRSKVRKYIGPEGRLPTPVRVAFLVVVVAVTGIAVAGWVAYWYSTPPPDPKMETTK